MINNVIMMLYKLIPPTSPLPLFQIMQALLGTSVVFACFSLSALYAPRGHYLYLGGTLFSALSTLFWLSLLNIFFGSRLIFQVCVCVLLTHLNFVVFMWFCISYVCVCVCACVRACVRALSSSSSRCVF